MRKFSPFLAPLLVVLTLIACAPPLRAEAPPASHRYLRYVQEPAFPRLETSIIRLTNKDGVTVDLIGAVHIADEPYYEQLNTLFKDYDVVLYEMVKPKDVQNVSERAGKSNSWIATIQRFMKSQLDLSHQLEEVDYSAKNFVHADLDAETFAAKQEERGEGMLSMMLDSMMKEMTKSPEERLQNDEIVAEFFEALQAPDRERRLKIAMAKLFSNMEESLDALGGDDSVIIGERNKVALKVLRQQIDAGHKHLAIFYGAGHLKGMEELMTELMGFEAQGEPRWLIAWDLREERVPATRPAAAQPEPEPAVP